MMYLIVDISETVGREDQQGTYILISENFSTSLQFISMTITGFSNQVLER